MKTVFSAAVLGVLSFAVSASALVFENNEGLTFAFGDHGPLLQNPQEIVVDGEGQIEWVSVRIVGLNSAYDGDLFIVIESPEHTFVGLLMNAGHVPVLFNELVFDDYAEEYYESAFHQEGVYVAKPTTTVEAISSSGFTASDFDDNGSVFALTADDFRLGKLQGESANGVWRLYAWDMYAGDETIADGWALNIVSYQEVPEPATAAALGGAAAFAAATISRNRNKAQQRTER